VLSGHHADVLHRFAISALVAGLAIGGIGASALPGSTEVRRGGEFRIAVAGFDSIDPALTALEEEVPLRATCAQLMTLPGARPEVSAGYPKVSRNRRTYTFTVRKGFRFSTGEPVTARSFARAIRRLVSPAMRVEDVADVADHFVGGRAFSEGRATTLRGVRASGRRLVLRLTKPWPDLLLELGTGRFCPVPARLGSDPEGVGAPLPGSGPYWVARFVRGKQAILLRNRFYRGRRPQHVQRFVLDLENTATSAAQQVVQGKADLAYPTPAQYEEFARKFGVNRKRFFTFADPTTVTARMLILNTQRPLFRNNPRLRRAVGFAINRERFAEVVGNGAVPADQFLSPLAAGFRDVRIYPPHGNMSRAKALARGRTRSGKAVLYVSEFPFFNALQATEIRARLRQIGIEAEIHSFPRAAFVPRLSTPGEPFDMALSVGYGGAYPGPAVLSEIFRGGHAPPSGENLSRFDSPKYNRLLDKAERLPGAARFRLYGRIDVQLARDAVPAVPLINGKSTVLVSRRVGCHRFTRPLFDLATVCLRR